MSGPRRKCRMIAVQALYELDSVGHTAEQMMARVAEETKASAEVQRFAREVVDGVQNSRDRIDEIIRQRAPAWPLEQMAAIDRNILRVAIYEVVIDNKVPMRAAINEAVELAKEFGGETSPRFVNGVLGSISLLKSR